MRYRGRTLGFSRDHDALLSPLQASWSDAVGRFYELSLHHATIGNRHLIGNNIVRTLPLALSLAEARVSLPLVSLWHALKLDVAGRLQDGQPRPHGGYAAAIEVALRASL
jgi:hypothetical protein